MVSVNNELMVVTYRWNVTEKCMYDWNMTAHKSETYITLNLFKTKFREAIPYKIHSFNTTAL